MSTDEERTAAFAYQVEVCTSIRQAYPDAYFGRGFAERDFSKLDADKEQWECWEKFKKDYPDTEFWFTPGLLEYGNGRTVVGWRDILAAQRKEQERRQERRK